MPSAKTVAQKPGGSVRPALLFVHAWLAPATEIDCFLAETNEWPKQITTTIIRVAENVFCTTLLRIAIFPQVQAGFRTQIYSNSGDLDVLVFGSNKLHSFMRAAVTSDAHLPPAPEFASPPG